MGAPERIETERLLLRRPCLDDAAIVYSRYASDREVTLFVGWPRHRSISDTQAFLEFSEAQWQQWPAGPYLIERRSDGRLIGSTGLGFETRFRAATGYVFAQDSWGQGFATEALRAVVALAPELGVRRLYALCHPDHVASQRVLDKCGFSQECLLRRHTEFPNLEPGKPFDVLCFARLFG